MKRFLITGCPRSGTRFAAALFRALGVRCGHEDVFGIQQALGRRRVEWKGHAAESSWLAVPSLPLNDVVVLHQVRHPLEVSRSIVGLGLLADAPKVAPVQRRFANVIRRHAPRVFSTTVEAERAALLWRIWNTRTEQHARITYRLEDLDADLVLRLARVIGLQVSPSQAANALDLIPARLNHRRRDDSVGWNSISPIVGDLATEYGYGETALVAPPNGPRASAGTGLQPGSSDS